MIQGNERVRVNSGTTAENASSKKRPLSSERSQPRLRVEHTFSFSSCYHSAVAAVSGLGWAVQAAGMEVVVQALVAEVEGVWPGSESLKRRNDNDQERSPLTC